MSRVFLFIAIFFIIKGEIMGAKLEEIRFEDLSVPIIYENSSSLPVVNFQIIFKRGGSIYDENLSGLSHISAKLLNEGTKKDGSVAFAKRLEGRAIHLRVHSGTETFVIELSALKSEFKTGINLLKELLSSPNYDKDVLNRIKNEIHGVILRKKSDFDYIAKRGLLEKIFSDTPMKNPSFGTKESIESITLKDIENFFKRNLIRENAIVVAGGDISLKESKNYAKDIIKILNSNKKRDEIFFESLIDNGVHRAYRDTHQAYIYFGAPLFIGGNPTEHYKAKVASFILGSSGFGSRILEEIRVKRGLAYSASMRYVINRSHSYVTGHLQTKVENESEAIKIVKEVVDEFVKNGATQKELDSAKMFLLGSEPLRSELLNQRLSTAFSEYYKGLPLGYREKELDDIQNLTLKELNDFISYHKEIVNLTFFILTKEEKILEAK